MHSYKLNIIVLLIWPLFSTSLLGEKLEFSQDFDLQVSDDYTLKMIWVDAGEFMMGSPESEEGRDDDEPLRKVKISKGFWLGQTELTQGQWVAVMKENPSFFKAGNDFPAEQVSWSMAMDFCTEMNAMQKKIIPPSYHFTLPTEAQWEYACRAGTDTAFCYGNDVDSTMLNFDGNYPS